MRTLTFPASPVSMRSLTRPRQYLSIAYIQFGVRALTSPTSPVSLRLLTRPRRIKQSLALLAALLVLLGTREVRWR